MKTLKVKQACTVIQLVQEAPSDTPLEEQALPYLEAGPFVLLDVRGVMFGSMQIGELVNLGRKFKEQWGDTPQKLGLVNLSQTGREVFSSTKLDHVFPIFDSLADAFAAFAALRNQEGSQ